MKNLSRISVLDVSPPLDLDLDRHRWRLRSCLQSGDLDPLDLGGADDETGSVAGVAPVQQLLQCVTVRDRSKRGVIAVDRLGPCACRAARSDLQYVWGEPAVGQREVERRSASVAREVEISHLGWSDAVR